MYGDNVTEPRLRCVLPFEAVPAELCVLRKAVREQLACWGALGLSDAIQLAVTELATNVIKHVGTGAPTTLVMELGGGRIRVELHDTSHVVPTVAEPDCGAECGRGLHLLAGLAAAWGIILTAAGKAVWCEMALEPSRHCARLQRAAVVLAEYRRAGGSPPTAVPVRAVLEESVTGVIADLLHWLATEGGEPDDALDRALMRYEAEVDAAA
ncbi:ATP-binding protein [Streptomyces sp. NBC_01471]|uniref:ATP-binding protein n=1 Tax=Streptomyces sp. NBC_01471 TaxID=2903879 RepID=UPI003243A672